MTWLALRAEIAAEFREHAGSMWDAWDMWRPTRDEAARQANDKAATDRRAAAAHRRGDVRAARAIEARSRAQRARRKREARR